MALGAMMIGNFLDLLGDEAGATAIEYGLIVALVSVAGIASFESLGAGLDCVFNTLTAKVDKAVATVGTGSGGHNRLG